MIIIILYFEKQSGKSLFYQFSFTTCTVWAKEKKMWNWKIVFEGLLEWIKKTYYCRMLLGLVFGLRFTNSLLLIVPYKHHNIVAGNEFLSSVFFSTHSGHWLFGLNSLCLCFMDIYMNWIIRCLDSLATWFDILNVTICFLDIFFSFVAKCFSFEEKVLTKMFSG